MKGKTKTHPPPLFLLLPPFKNHIFSVGLRIDGRVRASGSGSPPWAAFAAQLPPMEGVFKGEFVVVVFDTGLEVEVLMETSKKEEKGKLTSSIFFFFKHSTGFGDGFDGRV